MRKKKKGCAEEMARLIVEKFTTKPQPGNKRSWRVQVGRRGGQTDDCPEARKEALTKQA